MTYYRYLYWLLRYAVSINISISAAPNWYTSNICTDTHTQTNKYMHTCTTHAQHNTTQYIYIHSNTSQSFWRCTKDIGRLLQWSTRARQVNITNSSSDTIRRWWVSTGYVILLWYRYRSVCLFFSFTIIQYLPLPWLFACYGRSIIYSCCFHLTITIRAVRRKMCNFIQKESKEQDSSMIIR